MKKSGETNQTMFKKLDTNQDGVLTVSELVDEISKLGSSIDLNDIRLAASHMDRNFNGVIEKNEFMDALKSSVSNEHSDDASFFELTPQVEQCVCSKPLQMVKVANCMFKVSY